MNSITQFDTKPKRQLNKESRNRAASPLEHGNPIFRTNVISNRQSKQPQRMVKLQDLIHGVKSGRAKSPTTMENHMGQLSRSHATPEYYAQKLATAHNGNRKRLEICGSSSSLNNPYNDSNAFNQQNASWTLPKKVQIGAPHKRDDLVRTPNSNQSQSQNEIPISSRNF